MKLDIDTTIGWGDKTLAAFAVKGFDNSCHFTGQKNSLILITGRTIHTFLKKAIVFDGVEDGWMSKINIASYVQLCVNDCVGLKNRRYTK